MADYLYVGRFSTGKNLLHHQELNESILTYKKQNSGKRGKRVTFQGNLVDEKPEKRVQINFSSLLASTWYATTFKELSVAKLD